jgi:hypothetical protein
VGGICVAIQRSSPRRIGQSGPVVAESDKGALNPEAEGKKDSWCGDNSGGRRWRHWARVRATSANRRQVVWAGRHRRKKDLWGAVPRTQKSLRSCVEGQRTELNSVRRWRVVVPREGRKLWVLSAGALTKYGCFRCVTTRGAARWVRHC